jgi:hypothetical protein
MRPDPFCDPGDDGQDPDSGLPPAGPDAEPARQGLFLCLPAGSLDTGQFAQSGPAADIPPDPLLATIIDTVTGQDGTGLAGLSDDQLIGVIAAVRRLESRTAWYLMAAVGEFTARQAGPGCVAEFAADQLAHELHLTNASAAAQMDYAATVTGRLPATCAALRAGAIHPVHARIIEDETRVLSAGDAATADAALAEAAGSLTFGKLRAAARRLVLELDPEAARKRKEAARQDAHVRRFSEESGNAGMVARAVTSSRNNGISAQCSQHSDPGISADTLQYCPDTRDALSVRARADCDRLDSGSYVQTIGTSGASAARGPQDVITRPFSLASVLFADAGILQRT